MDAVVMAGGRIKGTFAEQEGVSIKALLSLDGQTLIERTVNALHGCSQIDRICVVGPQEIEKPALTAGADLFVNEGKTGIDNLMLGIHTLGSNRILCSASDLPLVRCEDVEELINLTPPDAQLTYAVFTRQEWDQDFPDDSPFYVRLSDGDFTGGCMFVLDTELLKQIEPMLQHAFTQRKSIIGMARMFGFGLTLKFLMGFAIHRTLGPSSENIRRRAESMFNCRAAIIRGCSPTIAADVDDLNDWNARQKAFNKLNQSTLT